MRVVPAPNPPPADSVTSPLSMVPPPVSPPTWPIMFSTPALPGCVPRSVKASAAKPDWSNVSVPSKVTLPSPPTKKTVALPSDSMVLLPESGDATASVAPCVISITPLFGPSVWVPCAKRFSSVEAPCTRIVPPASFVRTDAGEIASTVVPVGISSVPAFSNESPRVNSLAGLPMNRPSLMKVASRFTPPSTVPLLMYVALALVALVKLTVEVVAASIVRFGPNVIVPSAVIVLRPGA